MWEMPVVWSRCCNHSRERKSHTKTTKSFWFIIIYMHNFLREKNLKLKLLHHKIAILQIFLTVIDKSPSSVSYPHIPTNSRHHQFFNVYKLEKQKYIPNFKFFILKKMHFCIFIAYLSFFFCDSYILPYRFYCFKSVTWMSKICTNMIMGLTCTVYVHQ